MFNKKVVLTASLLSCFSSTVPAGFYEWVDAQGRHHYSDRKHEDARVIVVNPGTAYHLVEKVFDGDTILLANRQKIRLLGINTPEVASRNKNAEVGGEAAKEWLTRKISHQKVRLEGDIEKQDKYGRRLAHVFTENHEHINLELVRRGLAAVNIHPPNFKYIDSLLSVQQEAERARRGIWREAAYEPINVHAVNPGNYKGWKRIKGRVVGIKTTDKYRYLQFSDHFAVRIENKALSLFEDLSVYNGVLVEARGWIVKQKDRFVLPIRHPGELKVIGH
ncbi:MAG: thermonuclease family protein [Gammaproteobacteria bacterium]